MALPTAGLLLIAALAQDGDPAKQYQTKLRKIWEDLAGKHAANATFLAGKKQHAWAVAELKKGLDLDPANANINKKLGNKKQGDEWVRDPDAKIKSTNELDEEAAVEVALAYSKRLDDLGKSIAPKYVDAAKFVEKNGLGAEDALRCWRSALEYDPNNKDARKKLGFVQDKESGQWRTEAYTELVKAMKGAVAAAPKGADSAKKGPVEERTGVTATARRASERFLLESTLLTSDRLAMLLQHAEGTLAMYRKLAQLDANPLGDKQVFLVYYQAKAEHDRMCDAFLADPRMREEFKKSGGLHLGGIHETLGSRADGPTNDFTVHSVVHSLTQAHTGGGRAWFQEGMAYVHTMMMLGTADNHCTSMTSATGNKAGKEKNFKDGSKWRGAIRDMVMEMSDPDINTVFKSSIAELDGSRTVKAWSLVDFLIREHGDRFQAYLAKLKEAPETDSGDGALKDVFGWTLPELDEKWRSFVRGCY